MDANSGLMVGCEEGPVFIKPEVKELTQQDGQVCKICSGSVGFTINNEPFVACNECAFPVCRGCYEHERKDGEQVCPSCKTKYTRLKGSPRVEGDEEEDEADDLENEFNFHKDTQQVADDCMGSGRADDPRSPQDTKLCKERVESWESGKKKLMTKEEGDPDDAPNHPMMDEARQPLSRKVPIASKLINPYRMIIVSRLVVTCFFFRYRLLNPVTNAPLLWLVSVICEIWFALSWIFDQFQKWSPIRRETYLDRLSLRVQPNPIEQLCQESQDSKPSELPAIDVYVSTVDPHKEPPLVTANTVLSILSVDYPIGKVSCYVSDDGASMLTYEALHETSEFARKWVPFCKKYNIEPRAPGKYFEEKIDYLKDKVEPAFVKERRSMKREYEEFKVKVNALVAKAKKVPEEGWTMSDGTPWPGNDTSNHACMIRHFLGQGGDHETEDNELPQLVYVSREKKPGFNHHKKAGAMNALLRVSGVFTNAPYIINLDCDHYINNSKALKEAMCFLMDPDVGKKVCYVQFPQRFDDVDPSDRYANHNTVFFDINMKGLDGIQGPMYVGTGCVFRRQALYGCDAPLENKSQKRKANNDLTFNLEDIEQGVEGLQEKKPLVGSPKVNSEKRSDQSDVDLMENEGVTQKYSRNKLLNEAIHVIRCEYEDKTEWGRELGWIYGSITEDILTGLKMHCRGWRSIYCMPERDAFKGSAPTNLSDRLEQVHRWALGSVEIFFSRHCPIWYGYKGRLKWCQRLAYINTIIYPITSIALFAYCILPPICLVTEKFIIPEMSTAAALWFLSLFGCIIASAVLEMRWSGVSSEEWWRNEQFWVISGVSAHLFAVCYGLLKVLAGIQTSFTVTSKSNDEDDFDRVTVKWSILYIPAATVLSANVFGVVVGLCDAVSSGWGRMFGKLFFGIWVILHLYPFWLGLLGKRRRHTPTIVIVWSILVAAILSVLWIRIDPFHNKVQGPDLEQCGINC